MMIKSLVYWFEQLFYIPIIYGPAHHRVQGSGIEEQASDRAAGCQGTDQSQDRARYHGSEPGAEDVAQHATAVGTERNPDRHVAQLARNGEGDNAVHAQARQQQHDQ